MHCAHKLLEDNGVDVLSVKTDAFIIHKSKLETAKSLLNFGSDIGCWRNSKSDDALPPTVFYSLKQNDLIDIPKLVQFVDLEIEDEYDTDKMVKMIEDNKRVMIRADLAGSGKSYVCEAVALKHKTIFVTTTNKLCQKYQTEGA